MTLDEKLRLNEAIVVLKEYCDSHVCGKCALNNGHVCGWGKAVPLKAPSAWRKIETDED